MASTNLFEIAATARQDIGKGASRRLRLAEQVPAIVYGGGKPPVNLALLHKDIVKALQNEAFYSHILTLKTGSESERVILKALQRHAYKAKIVHIDFQRVRADEKLHMHVPLHFIGGDKAAGVKNGGILSHLVNDIEVICLPEHLPEFLEIDVSKLDLGQILHLSDIQLPPQVEIAALIHGDDKPVVSIHAARAEEVPTEAPTSVEVPAIQQKAQDDTDKK